MAKHIAYFVLTENFKSFKKGTKTNIRSSINDFFEFKKGQKSISFRADKYNVSVSEPIYSNINLKELQSDLKKEYEQVLETKITKHIERLGLIVDYYYSWTDDVYYSLQEIEVYYESAFYKKTFKTKLEKEIAELFIYNLASEGTELLEPFIKKELSLENKKIDLFIKKCDAFSSEVGFDVFESYLN